MMNSSVSQKEIKTPRGMLVEKACITCGTLFVRPAWRKANYCSNKCRGYIPWNKGKKTGALTEQHKLRISEHHKKNGVGKWMKGRLLGEKSPFWRGGVTTVNQLIRSSSEYKSWRKSVFERDNFTCVECGNNASGNLNADHIKPFAFFPELRFEINNGRTLCKYCHQKTSTFGWGAKKFYATHN